MSRLLFTERHGGMKPRTAEVMDAVTTTGLMELVSARIDEQWFGNAFPFACQDGQGNAGTDTRKLQTMLATYDVIWPGDWRGASERPEDGQIFDLIEFSYEHIAEPNDYAHHSYWGHSHYTYDQEAGRKKFEADVNRIFERNGMAFELKQGEVTRLAPTGLAELLAETVFRTGDAMLDELLEDSRTKFLHRDLKVRKESLEKLWDAWERLKTIGPGRNKAEQAQGLLERAASEISFRARLEKEARELTEIGNNFMIRHTETDKTPIVDSSQVDYLFHRMFAMIRFLLHSNRLDT
jgi:hypothetical protein